MIGETSPSKYKFYSKTTVSGFKDRSEGSWKLFAPSQQMPFSSNSAPGEIGEIKYEGGRQNENSDGSYQKWSYE